MTLPTDSGTATSPASASTPRLRMQPTGSTRTLLDGGWWPRSTDPAAELPGLVLAIDALHGPVTRLALSGPDWDTHPRRLVVAGRVLRLGYFTSQPTALLTARCDNGDRLDLLVVPPDTASATADAAMVLAATATNLIHAEHLLAAAGTPRTHVTEGFPEQVWETEGGHLHGAGKLRSPTDAVTVAAPAGGSGPAAAPAHPRAGGPAGVTFVLGGGLGAPPRPEVAS